MKQEVLLPVCGQAGFNTSDGGDDLRSRRGFTTQHSCGFQWKETVNSIKELELHRSFHDLNPKVFFILTQNKILIKFAPNTVKIVLRCEDLRVQDCLRECRTHQSIFFHFQVLQYNISCRDPRRNTISYKGSISTTHLSEQQSRFSVHTRHQHVFV